MRYAFINGDLVVVQIIVGALNPAQQEAILKDYAVLFGATFSVPIDEGTMVWIGGKYDPETGAFTPAPELTVPDQIGIVQEGGQEE